MFELCRKIMRGNEEGECGKVGIVEEEGGLRCCG